MLRLSVEEKLALEEGNSHRFSIRLFVNLVKVVKILGVLLHQIIFVDIPHPDGHPITSEDHTIVKLDDSLRIVLIKRLLSRIPGLPFGQLKEVIKLANLLLVAGLNETPRRVYILKFWFSVEEYATNDQSQTAFGILLAIEHAQGGAPAPSKYQPLVDAKFFSQHLKVLCHQIDRDLLIVLHVVPAIPNTGLRSTSATLITLNDEESLFIKELGINVVIIADGVARTAVDEEDRHTRLSVAPCLVPHFYPMAAPTDAKVQHGLLGIVDRNDVRAAGACRVEYGHHNQSCKSRESEACP